MKHFVFNIYHSTCLGCNAQLRWVKNGTLDVNVYSRNPIEIEGFFTLQRACNNPLCEWSKIKIEDEQQ